ncbi:MAG: hypothetical protein LBE25_11545 [Arthrobacter sp.]|jgi:hypothetical protein|nr:hypothetical protein [Arthrobacter sp.]
MHNRLRPLFRAWGASGVAVSIAVFSHLVAGGHAPAPLLVAMAWALGAVVALPFTKARPSLMRLAGLLLPSQLIYHLAFGGSHAGMHTSTQANTLGGEHAAHLAEAAALASRNFGSLGTSDPGSGALATGSLPTELFAQAAQAGHGMILAHVLSALASVLLIRHAERGLAAAWRWCTVRLSAGTALPSLPVAPGRPAAVVPSVCLPGPHLLGLPLAALRHRGPPALPAFA